MKTCELSGAAASQIVSCVGHDIGVHADAQPDKTESEEPQRKQEGHKLRLAPQSAPEQEAEHTDQDRDRRRQQHDRASGTSGNNSHWSGTVFSQVAAEQRIAATTARR
jgi:hypothetical protein